MSAFFFWTSWAASTNRPNDTITYTSNWPHEPLVGNRPTGDAIVWTGVSIIVLLAGIGAMAWCYASIREHGLPAEAPANDPVLGSGGDAVAAGRRQVLLGRLGADPRADPAGHGRRPLRRRREWRSTAFPLAKFLPYSIARTWHVQLGIFWIATAWLAAGLFIGPAVSGVEPKCQRLGVNVLFVALLLVVVGSMAGEWLSVKQMLGTDAASFYLATAATSTSTSAGSGRSRCSSGCCSGWS